MEVRINISWVQRPDLRDWFLIMIGIAAMVFGYAYGVATVPHNVRNGLSTARHILPLWVYGVMWALTGFYCILAAVTDRRIGGFVVATAMFTLWGMIYLLGWFLGDPGRGWVAAVIFGTFAGAIYCVSGLVDPTPIVQRDNS